MKIAAMIAALMLSASSAGATTLSMQNPSDVFDGGGNATVSGISNRAGTFSAGGFRVTDGTNSFVAWCLDVLHNLSLPGDYTATTTPFTNPGTVSLSQTQKTYITSLFTLNYNNALLGDSAKSAGFQLALWELVYETSSSFDVLDGSWTATNSAGVSFANQILASLIIPAKQAFNLTFYQSNPNLHGSLGQSLVSATPVPLPGAVALLAAALGGLGIFQLKKRKVATA